MAIKTKGAVLLSSLPSYDFPKFVITYYTHTHTHIGTLEKLKRQTCVWFQLQKRRRCSFFVLENIVYDVE